MMILISIQLFLAHKHEFNTFIKCLNCDMNLSMRTRTRLQESNSKLYFPHGDDKAHN